MTSLRKFTIRFFILLNIITGILFLLTCCNAFLHPDKWWIISLLAFFFPLFLILLLLFLFLWLFIRKRYAFISLLCLLIGWKNIHSFFGFSLAKHDFSLKILPAYAYSPGMYGAGMSLPQRNSMLQVTAYRC